MVAVVGRRRHPLPGVEAGDAELDAGLLVDPRAELAEVEQAGARGDPELDHRHLAQAARPRLVGRLQQPVGVLAADQEVEGRLRAHPAEERDAGRDQVQVQRLGEALDRRPPPDVAARELAAKQGVPGHGGNVTGRPLLDDLQLADLGGRLAVGGHRLLDQHLLRRRQLLGELLLRLQRDDRRLAGLDLGLGDGALRLQLLLFALARSS